MPDFAFHLDVPVDNEQQVSIDRTTSAATAGDAFAQIAKVLADEGILNGVTTPKLSFSGSVWELGPRVEPPPTP